MRLAKLIWKNTVSARDLEYEIKIFQKTIFKSVRRPLPSWSDRRPFYFWAGSVQAELGRVGPGQAGPGRAALNRVRPGGAEPGQAGPGRAGPGWAGPGRGQRVCQPLPSNSVEFHRIAANSIEFHRSRDGLETPMNRIIEISYIE